MKINTGNRHQFSGTKLELLCFFFFIESCSFLIVLFR